jgi:hypothetical protein
LAIGVSRWLCPRAVSLQVLHPAIASGLADHVSYRLWSHKQRSISHMIRLAYTDADARFVIRAVHEHVKGRDSFGAPVPRPASRDLPLPARHLCGDPLNTATALGSGSLPAR